MRSTPGIRWLYSVAMLATATAARGDPGLNMRPGVTSVSHQIYELHMLIFWICAVIGTLVFGTIAFILFRHRQSRGAKAHGLREHRGIEITWTVIPLLILVFMAIPATRVLIGIYDTSHSELTIQITGSQWKWRYDYLDQGVGITSNLATPLEQRTHLATKGEHYLREVDAPLVVPVGKKIRLLVTASDAIHSWWVPELGLKSDGIPGFINEAWTRIDKPGIYRGQCAELCGIGHGFMPIVVDARTPSEFDAWLALQHRLQQQAHEEEERLLPVSELMTRGETVFTTHCAVCHQQNGEGIPGTFPPLKGSKVVTGPLAEHIATILNGRPGTAMASFAQMSNVDLAALLTYERNAWGNGSGSIVQSSDIKAARTALGK